MSAQRQDKVYLEGVGGAYSGEARGGGPYVSSLWTVGLCLSLPCTCHSFKAASCIQTQKQPDSCPCLTPLDSFPSHRPGCRLCGTFLWRLLHLDLKTIPVFPSERSSYPTPECLQCSSYFPATPWNSHSDHLHLLTWNFNLRLQLVFPAGPNFISFISAVMVDLWLRCFQHQAQRSPSGHEHERR